MTTTTMTMTPAAELAELRAAHRAAQLELAEAAHDYAGAYDDGETDAEKWIDALTAATEREHARRMDVDTATTRLTIQQRAAAYAAAAYAAAYTTATDPRWDDERSESPIIVADAAATQMAEHATQYPYRTEVDVGAFTRREREQIAQAARHMASTDGRIANDWPHPYTPFEAAQQISAAEALGLLDADAARRDRDMVREELGPDGPPAGMEETE